MMPSQRFARIAGIFYLLNFVLGITAMVWTRQGHVAASDQMQIAGGLEYALVVVLLGRLFEDASVALSWAVAVVGLAGCATGVAAALHVFGSTASALAVFGIYCLGLGALVLRSALVPRLIGGLLLLGGVGWLTYADLSLARSLQPYNMACGILAELIFTLWLIAFGIRRANRRVPA
jgi:hypothetical protein